MDAADFRVKMGNVWMNATDVDRANAIPSESEGGKKFLSGLLQKCNRVECHIDILYCVLQFYTRFYFICTKEMLP